MLEGGVECENERFEGRKTGGKRKTESMRQPQKHRKRGRRKRERDRARELHAIRITSSIPQFGYVIFVAQWGGGCEVHARSGFQYKRCLCVNGECKNNRHETVINCCFAVEHAWVTCKQQLIVAMETNARLNKSRECGVLV